MNRLIAKILIVLGLALALVFLYRGLYYAPNGEVDEADSGLQIATSSPLTSVGPEAQPERLLIPKLDINAEVQHVGITRSGNMAAPNNFTDVGWYKYGTVPGLKGSAVIAGHVDNALGTPAIFIDLKDLELGDDIYIVTKDGERLHFEVIDEELYPYDQAPAEKIFNDSSGTYLNLITCEGDWVPKARSAANRRVIFAKLVE